MDFQNLNIFHKKKEITPLVLLNYLFLINGDSLAMREQSFVVSQ